MDNHLDNALCFGLEDIDSQRIAVSEKQIDEFNLPLVHDKSGQILGQTPKLDAATLPWKIISVMSVKDTYDELQIVGALTSTGTNPHFADITYKLHVH